MGGCNLISYKEYDHPNMINCYVDPGYPFALYIIRKFKCLSIIHRVLWRRSYFLYGASHKLENIFLTNQIVGWNILSEHNRFFLVQ